MKITMHIVASALLMTAIAGATTINFTTALPLGNLPESVTVDGLTISAWKVSKVSGTSWANQAILNNRNDVPDDIGLGVCSDSTNCPAGGGGTGDINEIDNNGSTFEVVQINTAGTAGLTSIGLSSLDGGLKDGYAIFGSNSALPNLSLLTPLASGTNASAGTIFPIISVPSSYQYYFVTSLNRGLSACNSDFLMESVTLKSSTTPEPFTFGLIGLGLAGIALAGRRMRQH